MYSTFVASTSGASTFTHDMETPWGAWASLGPAREPNGRKRAERALAPDVNSARGYQSSARGVALLLSRDLYVVWRRCYIGDALCVCIGKVHWTERRCISWLSKMPSIFPPVSLFLCFPSFMANWCLKKARNSLNLNLWMYKMFRWLLLAEVKRDQAMKLMSKETFEIWQWKQYF